MEGIKHLAVYMAAILPFIILGFHFADKWYLAKGRLWQVYILTIVGSLCTVVYNYALWTLLQKEHQSMSIFVFSINSAWTIAMAVKGIRRLLKEPATKRLPLWPLASAPKPAKFDTKKNDPT